jgi:hypothetical protein
MRGVRQFSQAISQGIAEHVNAPPLRKNQNRAVWGTGLITGCVYVAYSVQHANRTSLSELVRVYFGALHQPFDTSWPFYAWGA